jgi:hypothetical protein
VGPEQEKTNRWDRGGEVNVRIGKTIRHRDKNRNRDRDREEKDKPRKFFQRDNESKVLLVRNA